MYRKSIVVLSLCCSLLTPAFFAHNPLELQTSDDLRLNPSEDNYRLPNTTKPETYHISLFTDIHLNNRRYTGTVEIGLVVLEKTGEIKLHKGNEMVILSSQLTHPNGKEISLLKHTEVHHKQMVTFATNKIDLLPGERFILKIKFSQNLRCDNRGFYKSSYNDVENENLVPIAATQFAPSDARQAFPCYDEPALKANFTIEITHGSNYSAISNMPEIRTLNSDGSATTKFATSPLMSTYLVCFIISDYHFKANSPYAKYRQRAFVNRDRFDEVDFGLSEAEKLLNAIENYVKVPFSLPKIDHAIERGVNGAMENWGLITYEPRFFLYNERYTDVEEKNRIVTFIAHELAHQWFGNIVSPTWWSYLWLSEGLATLFENVGINLVHPDWNIDKFFVSDELQPTLRGDVEKTHAMTKHVETADEIEKLFDYITYAKSGSVFRMFLHAFGERSFKKGLNYYLKANAYQAVDEDDLFASLEKAVREDKALDENLNVRDIFRSWSNQPGFPLLKVKRNYETGLITLSQERYISDSIKRNESTWWIPYNIASKHNPLFNDTSPVGWLSQNTRSIVIKPNTDYNWSSDEWVIFNKQQTGYYRVMYDERNYNLMEKDLKSTDPDSIIDPITRSQIIDDLDELTDDGYIPDYAILFRFMKYLKRETDYAPWVSAKRAIRRMNNGLIGSTQNAKFRKFIASLVEPLYHRIELHKVENESTSNTQTRRIAIDLACKFGVESCLNETHSLLVEFLKTGHLTAKNDFASIIGNGVRSADAFELNSLWQRFIQSAIYAERMQILSSFAYISDQSLLKRFLMRSMKDVENKRFTQDERVHLIVSIARGSEYGQAQTIQLLLNNTATAKERLSQTDSILSAIAENIVSPNMCSQFSTLIEIAKESKMSTRKHFNRIDRMIKGNICSLSNDRRKRLENGVAALDFRL